jgi:hypothetical protein
MVGMRSEAGVASRMEKGMYHARVRLPSVADPLINRGAHEFLAAVLVQIGSPVLQTSFLA